MLRKFDRMTGINLEDILPAIKNAGECAGVLTKEGAKILDLSGALRHGAFACPPEGDAGTGMVATNSVAEHTGNLSAGTSVFAMLVLEKPLKKAYPEIDVVTTPNGRPVAMVHCNSCTSDIDAWVALFGEAAELMGAKFDKPALYDTLYDKALEGAPDGGGLLNYNYFSGEPVAGLDRGCPLFFRKPDIVLKLADFMRAQLHSALAALRFGMDILTVREGVKVDCILGHGGFFKTRDVGQKFTACALNIPVAVMGTAGEGGAYGIALLAAFAHESHGLTLEDFLSERVFGKSLGRTINPDEEGVAGFNAFFENYKKGLAVERTAADIWRGLPGE
jgi:sugar (pentulose or hexulose) kinase